MKKAPALLAALLSFSLFSLAQSNDSNLGIIPAPKSVEITSGHFKFSNESGIVFETAEDQKIALLFHDLLKDKYSLNIPVAKNFIKAPKGVIRFSSAEYKGTNPEGYSLTITPGHIDLAGKNAGLFYAFETLTQLLPLEKETVIQIPCANIVDEPRYKYRGLHLDVCRHMFPVSFVKKYIDLIAEYKLNTFHWHLTDDQGWRIEIKKYPKLTEIGGFRAQTIIGNNNERMPQWFDNNPYGGFYTQDQIKEVVAYASSKFVTVIPEIELPGHSLAALSAYPELACGDNPGPFKAAEKWGVFDDVYCAGKEGTFTFLEDVLSEVIELFPGSYIHLGGDESPKTKWKTCQYCQKRIRDNKLKDEHELQSYFIQRMEKFVNSRGRQIIGWDEILEGGLAPNATVMSWRGTEGGIAAAKQNHDVIMTPQNFVYLDHAQGKTTQEPLTIGSYTSLQETYSYEPTPSTLTADQQKHIVGVQANIWTEYIETPGKVEYMLLPRLFALSEIAWTPAAQKNYTDFAEIRVPRHLAKLDKTATVYRVPVAIGAKDSTLLGAEFNIDLKTPVEGAKIYYTINGYTPGETDNFYSQPVKVTVPPDEKRLFKTVVITPSGKKSPVTTTILSNLLPLAPLTAPVGQFPGLKYYFIPGEYETTASLDTAKASDRGVSPNVSMARFRSKARSYGLIFDGYINILEDGVTTFTTSSDDGSQIWIDDLLIVDNDQKHSSFEQTGAVNLLKGQHRIKIKYFNAGGSADFRTYMSQGARTRTAISPSVLFN